LKSTHTKIIKHHSQIHSKRLGHGPKQHSSAQKLALLKAKPSGSQYPVHGLLPQETIENNAQGHPETLVVSVLKDLEHQRPPYELLGINAV